MPAQIADAQPCCRSSLRPQANRLFSHNLCRLTVAVDELVHVAQFLFEGKRVVGPAAFAATYEQGAPLPYIGFASMLITVHELGPAS